MPVLAIFDAQGSWRDTHVCDGWITEHLAGQGVSWGRGKKKGQRVLDSAGLFYVPTADGYLGLLLEAGEWRSRSTACLLRCRSSRPSSKKSCP